MAECILAGRRGLKGDTGPQGIQGPIGSQGPAGAGLTWIRCTNNNTSIAVPNKSLFLYVPYPTTSSIASNNITAIINLSGKYGTFGVANGSLYTGTVSF